MLLDLVFFLGLRIATSYKCTIIPCIYQLFLREAFFKLLHSYRLRSETHQIEVSNLMFRMSYHTNSPDSKKSLSRETLPNHTKKRVLARIWEGCKNKGSRPICLEFRSSKWLIGWTAAVAAFTVCAFYSIFFVKLFLWGADMLMSYL